ncbi:MAG TPA: shikimate dehydrogenase [Pyrinomonadaceae bacterium]|nr:shikimate dehydrogenase [Pyrinomonadaceae bacterium]
MPLRQTMKDSGHARICVPVCARRAEELPGAAARAAAVADLIELRFDCLEASQLDAAVRDLGATAAAAARPLVCTFRPAGQGGGRDLDARARLAFWARLGGGVRAGRSRPPDFLDLELDLFAPEHAAEVLKLAGGSALICSHHDFGGTPHDLARVYEAMSRTPARVLKLAVRAERITDCLEVLKLLARARRDGREMIAVAMGEAGLLTRVLGPSRGSLLTYGAPDEGPATAPGQVSARELREVYRVHAVSERTIVTGLVGSPVAHSLSPHMHNAAFAACGVDGVYIPFEVTDLDSFMRRMADPRTRELDWNLRGFSVTAPHKTAIIGHLDAVEQRAAAVGAVNTVGIVGDDGLTGYNTDAEAALQPLRDLLTIRGARAAVLGSGGAARALLWALGERGARATVFARDPESARQVAADFNAGSAPLGGASFAGFDLVVNATPLGTRGARVHETPAAAAQLRGARVAYDLVYNPAETRFLREARAAGCETVGGLAMLVAQAAEQFRLWTGIEAPLEVMRAAAEGQRSRQ